MSEQRYMKGKNMASDTKRILVVDDEPKIVEVVKSYLENSGYEVYEAFSGQQAIELFDKVKPSLVILDLMLPDISGEEVCLKLQNKSKVPVIMLTAKVEEKDILGGLGLGADDYITKPFSPRQLVARVEAVLRRISGHDKDFSIKSFNNNDLIIDKTSHEVKRSSEVINLTPNEFKLLCTLVEVTNKTYTREELIKLALGEDFDGFDRVIDTHMKNLRQKIEKDPKNPQYILTVHGIGYKFGGKQ